MPPSNPHTNQCHKHEEATAGLTESAMRNLCPSARLLGLEHPLHATPPVARPYLRMASYLHQTGQPGEQSTTTPVHDRTSQLHARQAVAIGRRRSIAES